MELFRANEVIEQKISESDLGTFLVGFDLDDDGESIYRLQPLTKLLARVIPEFAFGLHRGTTVKYTEILDVLSEAACSIYRIDSFCEVREAYREGKEVDDSITDAHFKRGEFGELILHLLLRDFYKTTPLLSKIYFKDSDGSTVHGFDAVHIHEDSSTLWLGESKLYTNGKDGVKALVQDIKDHFKAEYLDREFILISKKLDVDSNAPERDKWLEFLKSSKSLKSKLNKIVVPLLCTYECPLFTKYKDETLKEFLQDYIAEMNKLKEYFDQQNNHVLKEKLKIILLLFPVQSKRDLVCKLHGRLTLLQEAGK